MLRIENFRCENIAGKCYTDQADPRFSYYCESDVAGDRISFATLSLGGVSADAKEQTGVAVKANLKPFTEYTAKLCVRSESGEEAEKDLTFETGRMDTPWSAKWITCGSYRFTEKKTSPVPMTFRKNFSLRKVKSVKIYATALGIYEIELNGKKVGDRFFAPGFTSYRHSLQYQVYDVTDYIKEQNELTAVVAGGWAVGAFVMTRKNRITAKRQAFLAEIRIAYADGGEEVLGTDESWEVTTGGKVRFAEFYDGEVYDESIDLKTATWENATEEKVKIAPAVLCDYGAPVKAHETFAGVLKHTAKSGELIYDFGQNFAGVVRFQIKGKAGQKIVVRHAEILTKDGELNTAFLRSAKCKIEYICREGEQTFMPTMTYMGFRYAGISGVKEEDILSVEGVALYSDVEERGSFTCSDERLNKLQSNITWSAKSNFIDIPTDCPQRDERMGWTGDIALFAQTACYDFDMARFLDKWLKDVRAEQGRGGGIPNTVPSQGYGFPATMPKKAVAFWGDACVFVPWASYLAYGNKAVLSENYDTMKKYLKACLFWSGLFSVGKKKYIWSDIPAMQFGDWVAPDEPKMSAWQARCRWTGTAAMAASSGILAKVARLLGKDEDGEYYENLHRKIADAYVSVLTDGRGKLKNEFQTAYVLPLYFDIFPAEQKKTAVENLVKLIERNDYRVGTGFPGTPYILFALADNGYADVAYKMLLNAECPSWLYEVEAGATTVWERWDGLQKDGTCPIGEDGTGGMVSFNHYTFGAVGDFLYRRVAGIEATEGGYKTFSVKPIVGEGLTHVRGEVTTPYGKAVSEWELKDGKFTLTVQVPFSSTCLLELPNGEKHTLQSGKYQFCYTV
jgi:alpha-L-rhamnosidase